MEDFRSRLPSLADRRQRSNERKYEALSQTWDKFVDAYLATNAAAIGMLEYPDLSNLGDDAVAAYLSTSEQAGALKFSGAAAEPK
jgi:predicted phosphoribosyltransferase